MICTGNVRNRVLTPLVPVSNGMMDTPFVLHSSSVARDSGEKGVTIKGALLNK